MDVLVNIASEGSDWWDLVPALLGAIVGAGAGAIPAFMLAKRSAKDVLDRDAKARKEADKAATFSLAVKVLAIADSIGNLRSYLREQIDEARRAGREDAELYQIVPAMAGLSEHNLVTLEPAELGVLFEARHLPLIQKLSLLQRRAAASHHIFVAYCERREALRHIAPTPDSFEGSLGRTSVTREQMLRLQIHTIPLNELITGLVAMLEEDWRLVQEVNKEFSEAARPILDMPKFTLATRPEADQAGPAATDGGKASSVPPVT